MNMKTESDYRAEQDLRTLTEARLIESDKKRLAAAKKMAREKLKEIEDAFPKIEGADKKD